MVWYKSGKNLSKWIFSDSERVNGKVYDDRGKLLNAENEKCHLYKLPAPGTFRVKENHYSNTCT